MNNVLKIALIREGKVPPDARVALSPTQAAQLNQRADVDIVVAPSERRTYQDEEYQQAGLPLSNEVADRELLLGIKEVPIEELVPNKTYCFFSHTIKEQPYNRDLLRAILEKNIQLIDYEVLTDQKGRRVIAFGYFAGMVGAHNGLWAYGQRTGKLDLPRLKDCFDYAAAKEVYRKTDWPDVRVVLTGTGRVGKGAAQVLLDMGFTQLSPAQYREGKSSGPVFTQLACVDYAARKSDGGFNKAEYYKQPELYDVQFAPYWENSDVFINGIYWDPRSPVFFRREDLRKSNFKIKTIADVTCDIAPEASIPTTLYASTIAEPVFGFDLKSGEATDPYGPGVIDVMSIDNLPSELPRDASEAFGQMFIEQVLPAFFNEDQDDLLLRATVAKDGKLGPHFQYLQAYVDG
ncbi:MAG: NAD(P)-dependent oxidoreductase [Bacteroidota bacterium]